MTIQDPRNRLGPVPAHLRLSHIKAIGLRQFIAEIKTALLIQSETGGIGDLTIPSNNVSALYSLARSQQVADLIAVERLLALIEASADHQEAVSVIEPLLALAAQDVADIASAEVARREAETALTEAEQAARQKLLAKVDADPAVKAARAKLDSVATGAAGDELPSDLLDLEPADPLKGDFHD